MFLANFLGKHSLHCKISIFSHPPCMPSFLSSRNVCFLTKSKSPHLKLVFSYSDLACLHLQTLHCKQFFHLCQQTVSISPRRHLQLLSWPVEQPLLTPACSGPGDLSPPSLLTSVSQQHSHKLPQAYHPVFSSVGHYVSSHILKVVIFSNKVIASPTSVSSSGG